MTAADFAAGWSRESCSECGTGFSGCGCPNCGQRADASWVSVVGFAFEDDDGPRMSLVEDHKYGWLVQGTRRLEAEQLDALRRHPPITPRDQQ